MDKHPVCDYEGSTYQAVFWDAGGRQYEDLCEANALRRLLPKRGRLLLELGAGAGRNTSRYSGFDRIVLLDYSRTQLQQARARLGDSERYIYVAANIYALPFASGLFDTATMIRTLHHMVNPEAALKETGRVMGSGAAFILEYANKRNYKSILRYILGRQNWSPFSLDPVEYLPLNFDFHPKAVQSWLSASGFQTLQQITVSHFRLGLLKRTIPARFLAAIDSLLGRTGNLWQYSPSVFVLTRMGLNPPQRADAFFRCPACGSLDLQKKERSEGSALECQACHVRYPFRDGIYDFKEPFLSSEASPK